MPKFIQVCIPFRPDHWKQVQEVAAAQGLSASAFIRQIAAKALKTEARR